MASSEGRICHPASDFGTKPQISSKFTPPLRDRERVVANPSSNHNDASRFRLRRELQIIGRRATICWMESLYRCDLAYVHAAAFGTLARSAANEIVRRLRSSGTTIRRVMDVGCGAGPLTAALIHAGFDVTGIDTSAELLKLARANVPTAHFVHASAYEVQIQGLRCGCCPGRTLDLPRPRNRRRQSP